MIHYDMQCNAEGGLQMRRVPVDEFPGSNGKPGWVWFAGDNEQRWLVLGAGTDPETKNYNASIQAAEQADGQPSVSDLLVEYGRPWDAFDDVIDAVHYSVECAQGRGITGTRVTNVKYVDAKTGQTIMYGEPIVGDLDDAVQDGEVMILVPAEMTIQILRAIVFQIAEGNVGAASEHLLAMIQMMEESLKDQAPE